MMKTRLIQIFLVTILAAMCSCASHDTVLYTLSLSRDEVILGAEESMFNVGVVGNAEFKATVQGATWLEVTNVSVESNNISLKAYANTTESARSAILAVTNLSSSETLMVKVLQAAASDVFLDSKDYVLWSCGYEFKLYQPHSSLYSVDTKDGWVKVKKTKDAASGVEVTSLEIEPNIGAEDRFTTVSISSSLENKDVGIWQNGNHDHIHLGIVHDGKTLTPTVTGRMSSITPIIDINWGDGNKGGIEDGGHTYTTGGTHQATIDCWGVNMLSIPSIGDATELTFGRRKSPNLNVSIN